MKRLYAIILIVVIIACVINSSGATYQITEIIGGDSINIQTPEEQKPVRWDGDALRFESDSLYVDMVILQDSFQRFISDYPDDKMPSLGRCLTMGLSKLHGNNNANVKKRDFANSYYEFMDMDNFDDENNSIIDLKIFFVHENGGYRVTMVYLKYRYQSGWNLKQIQGCLLRDGTYLPYISYALLSNNQINSGSIFGY